MVVPIQIAKCFIWSCQQCSIDSLLECTIKHMLFLKNVTKHADKLNKFGDTKTKVQFDRVLEVCLCFIGLKRSSLIIL